MTQNNKIEKLEIFPWNENFETGIKDLDEQHKSLANLLNQLAVTLTQEKVLDVETTFKKLSEYAEYHFKYEENIWKKYIPDNNLISHHIDNHLSFLPKIQAIKEKNIDFNERMEEVLLFLIRWLAFHIIDEDKRLAIIVNELRDGKNFDEAKYLSDTIMSGRMKNLINTIILMYDDLSLKAINLIRERKRRIEAEKELRKTNQELEKLSITDQLTKLYNRRFFDDTFKRELDKAKRNKTIINFIFLDIDNFKSLNDNYGHVYGDEVLIRVAECISKSCKRSNDFAFRIGGEEFAILITNEKLDTVNSFIELLQQNVKDLKIENNNGKNTLLTLSGGVVSKLPTKGDTTDSFIKLADKKLYQAKNTGKNRIVY